MKKAIVFWLLILACSGEVFCQNLLWERTSGLPQSEQTFFGCDDIGSNLFLFSGYNWLEETHTPNGSRTKIYWQVGEGETGNTLFSRYWDLYQYGMPFPFAADKETGRIYSLVRWINHQGYDSTIYSIRATSFNLDTTYWQSDHDINLFQSPSRWTRTMPAIDGGFIDCREKSVQGYISQSRVAKFDSIGNLEWQRQYGPSGHRCFTTWMDVTRDSCYIMSGMQHPLLPGSTDSAWCYLQKIDRFGNEVWRKTFLVNDTLPIKNASLVTIRIEETPDYGYLINGSFATSQRGYSLNAKFDSTLTLPGRKWYMPSDSAIAYGRGYADGSCMLAGGSTSTQIPFAIRRTGPNGETIWKKVLGDPCRGANAVVFNSDSTAILAGRVTTSICFNSPDTYDFWWAKIDGTGIPYNPLAIKEDVFPRAQRDEGMELYPNPAQEQITLKLPAYKGEKVVIFNHLGQKVLEERISNVRPQVSVVHLRPGLYRVRVGKWVKGFVKE